jgi:hypothetical protein
MKMYWLNSEHCRPRSGHKNVRYSWSALVAWVILVHASRLKVWMTLDIDIISEGYVILDLMKSNKFVTKWNNTTDVFQLHIFDNLKKTTTLNSLFGGLPMKMFQVKTEVNDIFIHVVVKETTKYCKINLNEINFNVKWDATSIFLKCFSQSHRLSSCQVELFSHIIKAVYRHTDLGK